MNGPAAPAPAVLDRVPVRWAALLLLAAVLAVYGDSLSGEFLFDDVASIPQNPTIRQLWPLSVPLSPPHDTGITVNGRPLLNLSFALNYAAGKYAVWGYHAANIAIHYLVALLLFGIVRRTFLTPLLAPHYGPGARALYLGAATALLWMVHPLQTESVAYVAQRAESLVGLFYLLTLYAFIRGAAGERRRLWFGLSVAACLVGMAVKEVMATAPLMVLLYDRTFAAGTFREAWRWRPRYYAALAATWLLMAAMMLWSHDRGGTAGFGIVVPWWLYALRQFQSVCRYLGLIVWPHPLVFSATSYNTLAELGANLWEAVPFALLLLPLLGATAWALRRRPVLGFLGAWFFVILAPSSSVVPVVDIFWEHRVYLSLAAPVALLVAGLDRLGRRGWIPLACLALVWGGLAAWRNTDYRTAFALWTGSVASQPENASAHSNLGTALLGLHRLDEAEAEFQEALRINPSLGGAHKNLGDLLLQEGRNAAAIGEFQMALRCRPEYAEAHGGLGSALLRAGRLDEADRELAEALRIKPGLQLALYELGNLRLRQGRLAEAAAAYRQSLEANPDNPRAHNSLGVAFAQLNRVPEAEAEFRASLRLLPDNPNAHYNLGNLLLGSGRRAEAEAEFRATLAVAPVHAAARDALRRMGAVP